LGHSQSEGVPKDIAKAVRMYEQAVARLR